MFLYQDVHFNAGLNLEWASQILI